MSGDKPFVIAIVGPTASGKSTVAIILAERLNGEVVSADSMMVYRGMDIGTAKPPLKLREKIPHHMIDIMEPADNCTAAVYQHFARVEIDGILKREKVPVVVGGTGLYVSAALDDLNFPETQETSESRLRLEDEAERLGVYKLHNRLQEVDPVSAAAIHVNNVRRVIRALEVYELTGKKYSDVSGSFNKRHSVYETYIFGISYDKKELKRRIAIRTKRMIENGWVDETRLLYSADRKMSRNAAKAIGYSTIKQYIDGHLTMEDAAEHIIKATTAYAKRQMTWFKADPRVVWFEPDAGEGAEELAVEVILYLKSIGKGIK